MAGSWNKEAFGNALFKESRQTLKNLFFLSAMLFARRVSNANRCQKNFHGNHYSFLIGG